MWFMALAGGMLGLGVFFLVAWLHAWPLTLPGSGMPAARMRQWHVPRRAWWQLAAALAGGVVVWLATGLWIAVVVVPAAVVGLPLLWSGRRAADRIARLEAMEEWTRSLAGVLQIGTGLEQALTASARSGPPAIAEDVARLTGRLSARWDTETAIRAFADDLADPTGDLIAISLILAARRRGTGLASVLEGLAGTVAADVRARRQVEADRAKPRATARGVTAISAAVILVLLTLARDYVAPYATPTGLVVLAILTAMYGAALVWMRRVAAGPAPSRSLGARVRAERDRTLQPTAPAAGMVAGGRLS